MPLFGLLGVISLPLCPGASPLAGSLPIWCWPSLPLVGGSHNWCIAIGTHPHMSHFSTLLTTLFGAYWQPICSICGHILASFVLSVGRQFIVRWHLEAISLPVQSRSVGQPASTKAFQCKSLNSPLQFNYKIWGCICDMYICDIGTFWENLYFCPVS